MSRLLLVRHGDTEFNNDRRFLGYSDVGLSPVGERQVECLHNYLHGEKINAIYASDLSRTTRTADVLNAERNLQINLCPELREMNYGVCEGLTLGEIKQTYPDVAKGCVNFTLDLEFPEGENFQEFIARTIHFTDRLKPHTPSDTILVISHNGPLRVLICHFLGIGMEHWWQIHLDTASLSIVDIQPKGNVIVRLNDTSFYRNKIS
jgi:alpha-ribazole phosphatase